MAKYDPFQEEANWWCNNPPKNNTISLPQKHNFAHSCVRSRLYDALIALGCDNKSLILEVGCGCGEDAIYVQKASGNIVGVDIAKIPLSHFISKGFQGALADVKNLPFHDDSFDYVVCSGLLHHLVGQGDLKIYIEEFSRVVRRDGYLIALEPNLYNVSGILMNIFNTLKPGITGLVPHERALSPLYLNRCFSDVGLCEVRSISASFVWNRFPLFVSKFISRHENKLRFKKPFNLFGWWTITSGKKTGRRCRSWKNAAEIK
jgi:SAM-dependent methyltransferase